MININLFVKSLKITWIRRIIKSESNVPWLSLVNTIIPNLNKAFDTGIQSITEYIRKIDNCFWIDTLNAWLELNQVIKPTTLDMCLTMPLWTNPVITLIVYLYKDWYCKGIKTIGDITDTDLNILSINTLVHKYTVQPIDFLTFHRIKSGTISILALFQTFNKYSYNQPYLPLYLQIILKDCKGVKTIYNTLASQNMVKFSSPKWNRDLNMLVDNDTWKIVFNKCFFTILKE